MHKETILDLNKKIMTDNAWKYIFGFKVTHKARTVIDALIIARGHAKLRLNTMSVRAMPFKAAVCMINDVSRPVADKIIKEALEDAHIKVTKDENNETIHHYSLGSGMHETLNELYEILYKVDQVIKAQSENQYDFLAGSKLVPEEIYFNLFDPEYMEKMASNIDSKMNEFKNGKNSKKAANSNDKGDQNVA